MAGEPRYEDVLNEREANAAVADLERVFGPDPSAILGESRSNVQVGMDLFENLPPRNQPGDTLGRPKVPEEKRSTAGKVLHNVAEIVPSAFKGMHDAVMWAVDPIAQWADKNIANLSQYGTYEFDAPDTVTGQLTKDISQFLTGFIPAARGLKALGMTNKVGNPMLAGAVADFAVFSGQDAKLSDLWKQMGLPENVLTDFLASDPEDTEIQSRAKRAIEGLALGPVVEAGLFSAMMTVRGVKHIAGKMGKETPKTERQALEELFGGTSEELADKFKMVFGDPSKPAIETHVVQPPGISKKVSKAGKEVPNLEPRSVVRTTKKTGKVVYELPEALQGTSLIDKSGKPIMMYHATHKTFPEISTKKGATGFGDAFLDIFNKLGAHFTDDAEILNSSFLPEVGEGRRVAQKYWDEVNDIPGIDDVGTFAPGANIRPVYLNIKKPFDIGSEDTLMSLSWAGTAEDLMKASPDFAANPEIAKRVAQIFKEYDGSPTKAVKEIKTLLSEKGYDGLVYTGEMVDIKGAKSYIAFEDSQIISAFDERAVIKGKRGAAPGIKSEDFEIYINFARIDEPDQVKFTIGKMAEAMKGSVDEARRGKITQEETAKMADELGMSVSELLERRKGQPLNAEEALAARQLWASSGEKLLELAKIAASPNAGPMDDFNFRRAMALHAAIQNEVIGARTETARALASWKIPAGGGFEQAKAIEQTLAVMGGPNTTKDMARRLAILAKTGASPGAISQFARKGAAEKSVDVLKQIWINGLLSSPKTHAVNILSNSLVVGQQIYERAVAGGISALKGGGGVEFGEATAMLHALMTGYKDSFRLAAKALKTGETGFAFNKIDVSTPNAISAEALNLTKDNGLAKFVDVLGTTVGVPGRLLGAEDEFFKSIGYRMEVAAQSVRQARREGLSGPDFHKRVAELMNDPPETIRINAADAAMYNTFTNEMGWFGKAVLNLRDAGGPWNPSLLVLPFVRTPANITRYTFERTPLAPLVGQWRADVAAGGARADLALARMATGTAIMATALDWAASGNISGEGPSSSGPDKDAREALLRSGWQPYSVKIGDRWYSYNRTDPLGMMLGISASIHEAVTKGEMDEDDVDEWQEVAAMTVAAVSNNIVNKTYLSGMSELVEMLNDPTRYSQGYINDTVASFLPFTAASGAVKNMVDPIQRDASTPLEAIQARIAGLSDKLPPRRDLWGRPISSSSGLGNVYDALSPVASRKENVQPIDFEINRLGEGPLRITKKTNFGGVRMNLRQWPEVYDEYVRLAGNELKHPAWGVGAMDYLNQVVSGEHPLSEAYKIMSDDTRRDFISNTITEYRQLAQQQILGDPKFADFANAYTQAQNLNIKKQMPVLGE